ncbi:MAG: alpha-keto acid decarboxylase family protein [Longimicrobiaceae bacterium]
MSGPGGDWTVARYLAARLEQLGITHLFGVPGNHLGPFLSTLHAGTSVQWVGTPTEMGAGYAADAFARVHGVGAVAVTYSVGAFSLLNTIGGAFVEEIPVIAINACPTFEQWQNFRAVGLLTSHMSPRFESNLEVYRQVTIDAQVVSNAALAPLQIDSAITACLSARRPVYLEVMEDVWSTPCPAPEGRLAPRERPVTAANRKMLARAVGEAVELIASRMPPILWGGEEIDRLDLHAPFARLVDATGIPFCTTIGGKSILSENHPGFHGVYNGKASNPEVRRIFKEVAHSRIGLGAWTTSKNLGGDMALGEDWIVAAHEGVSVGSHYFPDVRLGAFIDALREALVARWGEGGLAADYYAEAVQADVPPATALYEGMSEGSAEPQPESRAAFLDSLTGTQPTDAGLTYDTFFERIGAFICDAERGSGTEATTPYVVVSDAGFSLLGSQDLRMPERGSYFAQNAWLAIGWSMGAVSGIKCARPDRRPLVFVGDGSFQETVQEMSTHARLRQDCVVFVLNNEDFYGIEQMLVHPCFYAGRPEDEGFYNILHPWSYARLAEVFATPTTPVTGYSVGTHGELEEVLRVIGDEGNPANRGPIIVQVRLPRKSYPRAIGYAVKDC